MGFISRFASKNLTDEDNLEQAFKYLESKKEVVQRLNVSGSYCY